MPRHRCGESSVSASGLWGGAFAAIATTYDEVTGLPIPSAADAPWLGGLVIIGVAVVLMAVARTFRDDNIARIDAAIVGIGAGVVLAAFLWPELRDADLPRGGLAIGIAIGILAAFLVGSAARLAVTGASRLAAGRFTIEAVVGIAAGCILLRTTQFGISDPGAGQVGLGLSVAACWVLAGGAVHPRHHGSASASNDGPTTSGTCGSGCSPSRPRPGRSAPWSSTFGASPSTGSCSAGSRPSCSS